MKILVTGSNGQLGTELHKLLEENHPGITTYVDYNDIDLTDENAVDEFLKDKDFTHIVNCAAYTAVDRAEEEKLECAKANVEIVRNLAKNADEKRIKIIHISTDYVFDGTAHRPYRESDKVNPVSQYGSSKRKGETVLLGLAPDSIIIRTAWLYSTHGRNFVKTILNKADELESLKVVSDQIGTPTYARDLAKAILEIINSRQWISGIYNYSNEGVCSWYDFAKAILRISNKRCIVNPCKTEDYPTPAARPFYSVLDKSLIKATYGISIPHWEESLTECINQLNQNT